MFHYLIVSGNEEGWWWETALESIWSSERHLEDKLLLELNCAVTHFYEKRLNMVLRSNIYDQNQLLERLTGLYKVQKKTRQSNCCSVFKYKKNPLALVLILDIFSEISSENRIFCSSDVAACSLCVLHLLKEKKKFHLIIRNTLSLESDVKVVLSFTRRSVKTSVLLWFANNECYFE